MYRASMTLCGTVAAVLLWPHTEIAAENFQATVSRVVAPDIYEIKKGRMTELVVLYGVVNEGAATPIAQQAREFAEQAVLNQTVTVRVIERKPEMTLVELTPPDGSNLSHVMLRRGLVRWDSLSAPRDEGLRELERIAERERLGIWQHASSDAPTSSATADVATESISSDPLIAQRAARSGYEIIEGRIVTDEKGGRTLILRGTGQKIPGIEGILAQERLAEHEAFLEEQRAAAEERAYLNAQERERMIEAQRAEEEAYLRQLEIENQRLFNQQLQQNAYVGGGFRVVP